MIHAIRFGPTLGCIRFLIYAGSAKETSAAREDKASFVLQAVNRTPEYGLKTGVMNNLATGRMMQKNGNINQSLKDQAYAKTWNRTKKTTPSNPDRDHSDCGRRWRTNCSGAQVSLNLRLQIWIMSGGLRSCVDRAVKLCQRLIVPENLLDYQIDDAARQVILRMARGTETQCVTALGMVAAAKLGQLDEILGDAEEILSRAFSDFRETFDCGVAIAAAAPNPWMCAFVCALCAAAILDGVPGDEVPACALCLGACSQSA